MLPKLPIELHLKIWKEALSVPGKICVYIKKTGWLFEEDDSDGEDEDHDEEDALRFTPFVRLAACPCTPVLQTRDNF
jgi:hypothetical protein